MSLASNEFSRIKELVSPVIIAKTSTIHRKRARWKRNWKCPCGSEKKFKKCCWDKVEELNQIDGNQFME